MKIDDKMKGTPHLSYSSGQNDSFEQQITSCLDLKEPKTLMR